MLTKKESIKNEVKTSKAAKNTGPFNAALQNGTSSPKADQPQAKAHTYTSQATKTTESKTSKKEALKTKITVQFDAGFNNRLTIRGHGANLSWEKGLPLKNLKNDEWTWETDASFARCEFKILINDAQYESGENRILNQGTSIRYTPRF